MIQNSTLSNLNTIKVKKKNKYLNNSNFNKKFVLKIQCTNNVKSEGLLNNINKKRK